MTIIWSKTVGGFMVLEEEENAQELENAESDINRLFGIYCL